MNSTPDPPVENKMIKGKKMTVCSYVDNLKLSHVEPKEDNKLMEWL